MTKKNGNLPVLNKSLLMKPKTEVSKEIEVEDWGVKAKLRRLTGKEQQILFDFQRKMEESGGAVRFMAALIAMCMVDAETGENLLDAGNNEEVDWLLEQDGVVLKKISDACLEINGMTVDAADQIEKN